MSENENQPPAPSKQTSSVPLKKETVRVTLKAADSPPAVPSATVPLTTAPVRPPVPGAPPTPTGGPVRPPAPAPTIPLRPAGAPTAGPAPTIRLATSPAATRPSASPTGLVKPPGAPTVPLKAPGTGAPTIALPKATVQLQAPTQPLGTNFSTKPQAATFRSDDDEEEASDGISKILSGVGFAAALAVLGFQLKTADVWIHAEDNKSPDGWMQLFQ